MGPEETWYAAYEERIGQMCVKLAEGFSTSTINMLLAHLYVSGSQTSGSEREIHVAQPYAVSPQRFPTSAHYIGLGHLHRPQEVLAPSPCRYAGSPLQLDFGEQGQEKRVVLIEAHPGKSARLESISLTSGRRLRAVAGTIEELEKSASSFGQDYLHVTVKTIGPIPGIADRIREILPNALDVRTDYPRTVTKLDEERRHMAPDAMFAARQQLLFSSLPLQLCLAERLPLHKKERGAASVSTRPERHRPAFPPPIAECSSFLPSSDYLLQLA